MKINMTFEQFKEEYILNLDGYLPTYFTADEVFESEDLMRINVEMIAPYRMTDGPSRFFRVITIHVTKDQYEQVKKYAFEAGEKWRHELVMKAANCAHYSQTKF